MVKIGLRSLIGACVFVTFGISLAKAADIKLDTQSASAPANFVSSLETKKKSAASSGGDLLATFNRSLVPFLVYDWVDCNVPPGSVGCVNTVPLDVPRGWQACKPYFTKQINDGSIDAAFAADKWSVVDPMEPVSFGHYDLKITATPIGHLRLTNVGILALPAEATAADRFANGCEFKEAPTQ
jgi:hypothetical protein